MIVYLAASYHFKARAIDIRDILVANGITVNASWLDFESEDKINCARLDYVECSIAEALIFLNDIDGYQSIKSGKHVEFGIALGAEIPIYVLGTEIENIFHLLVKHFKTIEELISDLKRDFE